MLNSALADIPVTVDQRSFTVTSAPDVTPPGPFTIDDGGKYTSFDFGVNVKWTGSEENESGIHSYEYAIGTAEEPTPVAAWAPVRPLDQQFLFCDPGKTLQEGVEFFVSMRALNGQCMSSPIAVSDGIRYAPSYSLAQTRFGRERAIRDGQRHGSVPASPTVPGSRTGSAWPRSAWMLRRTFWQARSARRPGS